MMSYYTNFRTSPKKLKSQANNLSREGKRGSRMRRRMVHNYAETELVVPIQGQRPRILSFSQARLYGEGGGGVYMGISG